MNERVPTKKRELPKIYDVQAGYRVPSTEEAIERVKRNMMNRGRLKSTEARKAARRIVFGFQDGSIDNQTYDSYSY